MKICIYDDLEEFRVRWRDQLKELEALDEEDFEIVAVSEEVFGDILSTLEKRQRSFRRTGRWQDEEVPLLDGADIFVIDFDLLENPKDPFLKGDMFAYLARCFSDCGLLVGLNRPDVNDFDLTLKGHLSSFADVNIRDSQLGNRGLWGEDLSGFRPWYWPVLPAYRRDLEMRIEDVKEAIEQEIPIWEALGFPEETFTFLPRIIGQFLGGTPEEVGFKEFVMESGNCLYPKDAPQDGSDSSVDILARIGAARISKWLERTVLSEQNILVDAPHLVFRYPSLLVGDSKDINTWNETACLTREDLPVHTGVIETYRLKKKHWISRPVWFWEGVQQCDEISEVKAPFNVKVPDWVFCEDASQFDSEFQKFKANVESPFAQRYVKRFQEPKYGPKVRFSM